MTHSRFDRQVGLFGREGQVRLRAARVTVVGLGGIGSAVVTELALLGVGAIGLVEHDVLTETSRNRYFGARVDDLPGPTPKTRVAERTIREIDPDIAISIAPEGLLSEAGFDEVRRAAVVFGCVDREGIRLVLTELCAAYEKPYIDVASDVIPGDVPQFGGRVCFAVGGAGCLVCLGQLDAREASEDLASSEEHRDREAIYGVDRTLLARSGPSVVSINGVVASLAVTEFMKFWTGLCPPTRLLNYDGRTSKVTVSRDEPTPGCIYCGAIWGAGEGADVERYVRGRAPA